MVHLTVWSLKCPGPRDPVYNLVIFEILKFISLLIPDTEDLPFPNKIYCVSRVTKNLWSVLCVYICLPTNISTEEIQSDFLLRDIVSSLVKMETVNKGFESLFGQY